MQPEVESLEQERVELLVKKAELEAEYARLKVENAEYIRLKAKIIEFEVENAKFKAEKAKFLKSTKKYYTDFESYIVKLKHLSSQYPDHLETMSEGVDCFLYTLSQNKTDKMEYFNKTHPNNWSLLGYLEWRANFADFSNKVREHSVFFDLVKKISDEGLPMSQEFLRFLDEKDLSEVNTFWNNREIELEKKRKLWQIESSDLDYIYTKDQQLEKHIKVIRENRTTVEQTKSQLPKANVPVMDLSSILNDPGNSYPIINGSGDDIISSSGNSEVQPQDSPATTLPA
ncbi:12498_t:CDS:2 [Dentiscutata heterogama]|uniref:12498_t:CDS:1 n=1 Tax=Dentiscutata heterogama TaxID=1316150 RepID=A0ACA9MXL3_9GLOM|nr:12498_t:CDS:2 [Dentiscutata heterogama]